MIERVIYPALVLGLVACSADPPDAGAPLDASSDAGFLDSSPMDLGFADGAADAGPDAGDAGDPDSGGADTGPPAGPITERPSRGTYTCTVDRGRTSHSPKIWGDGMSLAVTSGGSAYFARLESSPPMPFTPAPVELLVSTFATDGTFGASVEPSSGDPDTITGPTLTPKGDGLAMVWVEGSTLRFGTLDASGQPVITERDLSSGTVDYQARPRIAAGPNDGIGIVYTTDDGNGRRSVRFLSLDAAGTETGPAVDVSGPADPYLELAATIAPAADGYAIMWRDVVDDRGRILFAKVGPTGASLVAPTHINGTLAPEVHAGGGVGFDTPKIALLAQGGGYLAAWPEHTGGDLFNGMGAWSVVKVARLDAVGAVVVAPVELRSKTLEFDEVEPTLVPFGNDVAVLWGRGSHIYFCGGCYPDNRIDLLLIDPLTLDPLSTVVTIPGTGGGGLMRREVAVLGTSLLVAYRETFHVTSSAGSANFICTN